MGGILSTEDFFANKLLPDLVENDKHLCGVQAFLYLVHALVSAKYQLVLTKISGGPCTLLPMTNKC